MNPESIQQQNKTMLIHKKAVRQLALSLSAKASTKPRTRVSEEFFSNIESEVRAAISRRVNFHDNKSGSRMTLI